jgi:hypothetical protein
VFLDDDMIGSLLWSNIVQRDSRQIINEVSIQNRRAGMQIPKPIFALIFFWTSMILTHAELRTDSTRCQRLAASVKSRVNSHAPATTVVADRSGTSWLVVWCGSPEPKSFTTLLKMEPKR